MNSPQDRTYAIRSERLLGTELDLDDFPHLIPANDIDAGEKTSFETDLMLFLRIESEDTVIFGFWTKVERAFIGACGISILDGPRTAELGFRVLKGRQQLGFGAEMVGSVTDYAFKRLRITAIRATADNANISASRALEKNGFVPTDGNGSFGITLAEHIALQQIVAQ